VNALETFIPQTQIVAAVQYAPALLDVRGNLATALQLTFEAAAKGAKLIVLPELCIGGYNLSGPREAMQVAQERDGYQTEAFVPICRRFNCYVVFGYTELFEGNLYNSAAVVGPHGLASHAQKHNLFGSDNLWAQPSETPVPVLITPAGRLGILICRDVGNKYRESYVFAQPGQKFYKPGDVDTIALLTNWGSAFGYPDSAWVELVEETRANLVVSNRIGQERDMKYKGGSCVIDRDRRIWTHGSSFTEAAVVGGVVVLT
jgi:predicted amidohydrolase